ncbi:MAG: hypothetical protein C0514_00300 [Candidatus Puniceispirillum sp.]|nr:hypothetical protein [Candidatus Puniceispirillum sp.]
MPPITQTVLTCLVMGASPALASFLPPFQEKPRPQPGASPPEFDLFAHMFGETLSCATPAPAPPEPIQKEDSLEDLQAMLRERHFPLGPESLEGTHTLPPNVAVEAWQDPMFLKLLFNHYLYEDGRFVYDSAHTWPALTHYVNEKWRQNKTQ